MTHRLRHVLPGVTYECVRRTHRGRYAFRPSAELDRELRGVIGEAQRRFPQVKVGQWHFLSTHFHALIWVVGPNAANVMAAWLNYVMSQAARVAQAVNQVRGRVWERKRCRLTPLTKVEQYRERAKYIMAQATAAGLVARPNQWPGLNTCDALCRGERMIGYLASAALRRQAQLDKVALVTIAPRRELKLTPLLIHEGWSAHARQRWYRELEREVIAEAAEKFAGKRYPPPAYWTVISPTKEKPLEDSPPPVCWGDAESKRTWRRMLRAFTDAWREALARWVNGERACFPPGGWVPFGACFAPGYLQRE